MKKFISFLTVAVLLVTMMATVAFAAESATVTVATATYEEGAIAVGDSVELTVKISEATFAAYGLKVTYDESALELTAITKCDAVEGMFVGNAGNGKVAVANAANNENYAGTLFTLTFKVLTADAGSYNVGLAVDSFGTAVKELLDITVVSGGVVIEAVEPETTVPETTVPETTVPETTVPETTVPETTVPETTVPETTVPETTVPETTVPETTEDDYNDTTEPDLDDEPKTGDITMMYSFGFIAVFCVLAAAFVAVKSKATK